MGETVSFKPLHAPAFMVDANQQVFANAFDRSAKSGELGAATTVTLPIAGKQNDATCKWVFQAAAVFFGQG